MTSSTRRWRWVRPSPSAGPSGSACTCAPVSAPAPGPASPSLALAIACLPRWFVPLAELMFTLEPYTDTFKHLFERVWSVSEGGGRTSIRRSNRTSVRLEAHDDHDDAREPLHQLPIHGAHAPPPARAGRAARPRRRRAGHRHGRGRPAHGAQG